MFHVEHFKNVPRGTRFGFRSKNVLLEFPLWVENVGGGWLKKAVVRSSDENRDLLFKKRITFQRLQAKDSY